MQWHKRARQTTAVFSLVTGFTMFLFQSCSIHFKLANEWCGWELTFPSNMSQIPMTIAQVWIVEYPAKLWCWVLSAVMEVSSLNMLILKPRSTKNTIFLIFQGQYNSLKNVDCIPKETGASSNMEPSPYCQSHSKITQNHHSDFITKHE